jgi:hypothetical protein
MSSSKPCSQTPSVCVPPLMSKTKFHSHTEAQAKLYSWIFFNFYVFSTADMKTEGSVPNGALLEFNLLLISSWIKFWFVTLVPKYVNCDTFLNGLFYIFMSWFLHELRWRYNNIYLVFCTFISRLNSLLASIKVSVFFFIVSMLSPSDRLCGLVVRVLGYRSGGPGSIPGTTRKKT